MRAIELITCVVIAKYLPCFVAPESIIGNALCAEEANVDQPQERNQRNGAATMADDQTMTVSREAAVETAAKCLGLLDFDAERVMIKETSFAGESIPFLRDNLNGKAAYRIVFDNVNLARASRSPELDNAHIRSFVVFVARETGRVVKVTSVWPEGVPRIAEHPSCVEEEHQMAAGERYTGVPSEDPEVSFAEAVLKSQPWSPQVKQLHAYYVMHSCVQYKDRPVWVIHLRGIPPIPFSAPAGVAGEIPEDARNHLRNIVDARTGEWLGADTVPQPAGPVELRY